MIGFHLGNNQSRQIISRLNDPNAPKKSLAVVIRGKRKQPYIRRIMQVAELCNACPLHN